MKSVRVTTHTVRVHSLALEEFLREFDDAVLPTLVQLLLVAHELLEFTAEQDADVLPFDELSLEDADEALQELYWLFRGSYSKDEAGEDPPEIVINPDTAMITLRRKPPGRPRRPERPPTSGLARVPILLYRSRTASN